jgi:hypothetical protein
VAADEIPIYTGTTSTVSNNPAFLPLLYGSTQCLLDDQQLWT